MINKSEIQEKTYLEEIRNKLLDVIKKIDEGVMEKARSLKEDKEYLKMENQDLLFFK